MRTTLLVRFKQFVYFAFDYCALEEIRIHIGPQSDRVDEHEITKILVRDNTIVNQFKSLLGHLSHIRHVPMADIGTEDRAEPGSVRISPGIESHRVNRIIRFAAE